MTIGWRQAEQAVSAAVRKAEQIGVGVSIAVTDPRGDLLAFARLDGARFFTVEIACGKARVAAFFGQPSGEMAERIGEPGLQSIIEIYEGRLLFVRGGVPLQVGAEHAGGIGVSGGTADQDEEIAQAGAAGIG